MNSNFHVRLVVCALLSGISGLAQQPDTPATPERWNLYYQATSIGQYHGTFTSPYSDAFSLQDYPERDVSLTTTIFFGLRLSDLTTLYLRSRNRRRARLQWRQRAGQLIERRVAAVSSSAEPKPYLARLYVSHDFALGSENGKHFESDENQLAGDRPVRRYTITAGRFTLTDFFDDNRYSHDPRTQFMGWAAMYNGAWDYPADCAATHGAGSTNCTRTGRSVTPARPMPQGRERLAVGPPHPCEPGRRRRRRTPVDRRKA